MSGAGLLAVGGLAIIALLVMVIWIRVPAFVALLLVAFGTAIATGMPLSEIVGAVQGGLGSTIGSVMIVVGLGAMLGRMIEVSGGASAVAEYFTRRLGAKRVIAAITIAAFVLGIPVFFDVGFIVLAPIIFGFARTVGLNPLKIGLPVAATLLTVHVAIPPHPGPVATAEILGVDIGTMLLYGLPIAALTSVFGYFIARAMNVDALKLLDSPATQAVESSEPSVQRPPSAWTVMALIVLPILQIMVGTTGAVLTDEGSGAASVVGFIGAPPIALLTAVIVAWFVLGFQQRWSVDRASAIMDSALPTVAIIVFVTAGGGAFASILVESGIGKTLSEILLGTSLPLILLAYVITAALRAAQGSATVALLTTAGLLYQPIMDAGLNDAQVTLIALAIAFGGLGLSHINDSGFWIVTKYLGLSVKDGLKHWTTLSTAYGLIGFVLTWAAYAVVS